MNRLTTLSRIVIIISLLFQSFPSHPALAGPPRQGPEPTPVPLGTPTVGWPRPNYNCRSGKR